MSAPLMWGGRFGKPPDARFRRLNDSLSVDRELLAQDLAASGAWAEALARAGVLTPRERARLVAALRALGRVRVPARGYEDVHSYVESQLHRRLGALAHKLHTGRSRNDQVATDLKLYLRAAMAEARSGVLALARALAVRAEDEHATPMPGYTHGKLAEPVTFGHFCLAHVEMLLRDADRLDEAMRRGDECPLGSGALAGTPVAIDRAALARRLGFARPTSNSIDAVSDRDMAADYLYAGAMVLSHLSRLAADLMVFSADETGFVELPDAWASGSSRMPHKKNPDLLELARGHAARASGDLAGLLALLKGLPLAYDKDLQLDKEPVFRMRGLLSDLLPALAELVASLVLHRDRMRAAALDPSLVATDRADALAASGTPFREAHARVGAALQTTVATGEGALARALQRKAAFGGTAPARVRAAARRARARIARLGRIAS